MTRAWGTYSEVHQRVDHLVLSPGYLGNRASFEPNEERLGEGYVLGNSIFFSLILSFILGCHQLVITPEFYLSD